MNVSSYIIPRLALHLSARSGNQQEPITKEERALQKVLAKVKGNNVLRNVLRKAGKTNDVLELRKTISMLRDQLRDVPGPLKEVIGEEGISLLKNLS